MGGHSRSDSDCTSEGIASYKYKTYEWVSKEFDYIIVGMYVLMSFTFRVGFTSIT